MTATLEMGPLAGGLAGAGTAAATHDADTPAGASWRRICAVADLELAWGEAALVAGQQIALFRVGAAEVFAVANQDPATGAQVMARGILGSRGQRPTIASPLHKEVYDLESGTCFTSPELALATFGTRLVEGFVEVVL